MANAKLDPGAADVLALRPLMDNSLGHVSVAGGAFRFQFYMAPQDSAGEGTVPVRSGSAVAAGSKSTYCLDLSGVGHEGAYRIDTAQRVSLHSILQIAQAANVLL